MGEMANGEFLLVFNTLGVYVDVQGRKSRDKEIMFPAMPTDVAVSDDGGLLVYSDTHIDVFDTNTGDWVQTINIRKTRPLIKTGVLNLSMLQELPHITYLCSYQEDTLNVIKPELMMRGRDGRPVQRTRRRFSVRETNKQIRSNPDRRSKLISAPSNFNHISHMGPGDGIQIQRLMDLPTTLETADTVSNPIISSPLQATQPPGPPGTAVRVKSMIQQSPGGKLPSRLPSAHPAHPQRSISHNEAGMRSYFNGGGSTASSATPPPSLSGRTRGSTGQMIAARSSSASLPRSPESDLQAMIQ